MFFKKIHFISTTSLPFCSTEVNLGDMKTLKTPEISEAYKYETCGNKKLIAKRKVMYINPKERKLNKKARVLADNIQSKSLYWANI